MVAWFALVEREQTLQSGSLDFGGEENVTKECLAWNDKRKALSRIGVNLYDCEIGYKLLLLTGVERWFDRMMFFFVIMAVVVGDVVDGDAVDGDEYAPRSLSKGACKVDDVFDHGRIVVNVTGGKILRQASW